MEIKISYQVLAGGLKRKVDEKGNKGRQADYLPSLYDANVDRGNE